MRPLLLAAAACLLALPAAADSPEAEPLPPGLVLAGHPLTLPAQPLLRPQAPRRAPATSRAAGPKARSASAHAPGIDWLGVFADGPLLFTVPHDGVGLDLRGGAYLQLLQNLSLSGSYRVFDYDDKASDGSLDGAHGPLFGLRLSF
jgi:opacity protein-like surface antigen